MEYMEMVKHSWDSLDESTYMQLKQAIEAHRKVERGLGFPFAFWKAWDAETDESCMCVEYYLPEERKTHWYHYKWESGHWAWW